MVKFKIPFRFSNENMNSETFERFKKYLGGIENFFIGQTIQYLNLRIFAENNSIRFRIVNNKNKGYKYPVNEYVKALLRTYSDGIITTEKYLINHPDEDFEIDYDTYDISKETFYVPKSSLLNKKKSVGVFTKDLKINLVKSHPLFRNDKFDKHILIPQNNIEKFQEEIKKINEINFANNTNSIHYDDRNNIFINLFEKNKHEFLQATRTFLESTKLELFLIEGNGDHPLNYLHLEDPAIIPSDILVVAFVKDGEYNKEDISRPFDIWQKMEKNFIKLYQSKKSFGNDGSTWFFSVFKKRMLIKNNLDKIDLTLENPFFDQKFFKNQF